MLRMADLNNPIAGKRLVAARLDNVPAGHPLGSWLFFFFPCSPIRLNEIEPFVGLEVAGVQFSPSRGIKGLK